jgi:hypothetical protein
VTETPEDGRLLPKHVVRRSDRRSCILDGIMLCIKIYYVHLAPDKDHCWLLANMVVNFLDSIKGG